MMKSNNCLFEWSANLSVGVALGIIALGFFVVSITILPVIGLVVAVPVAVASVAFLSASRSPECAL